MRRTKEEAEQTKAAILDAAIDIFSSEGVAKTSLEQIAKKADVTRGAVYWHFKNKREIFEALHDDLHTPFLQEVLDNIEKSHDSPLQQLESLCVKLLIDLQRDKRKQRLLSIFMVRCDYSGELSECREIQLNRRQDKLDVFRRYFEKAAKQHPLPAGATPRTMTLAVACYMRGIIMEFLDNPELLNLEEEAPAMVRLFFAGLSPQTGE